MCGRLTILTYEELRDVADAVERKRSARLRDDVQRGQARPGSAVWAIAPAGKGEPLVVEPFTWGFDAVGATGKLVFNTRIESALGGSRMWDEAVRDGRCILPAASFFEPHMSETARSPITGRSIKRQYEFVSVDGAPLLLASVQRNGRLSVVTTEPNTTVAPIHARMPLVLRFDEVPLWLGDGFATLADRSGVELRAQADRTDGDDSHQLSLF